MIPPWLQAPLPRRLLFLTGNLAAGLAIMFVGVVPVMGLLADRDREILQQRMILSRLQAVAAHDVSMQSGAKAVPLGDGEFLTGKTDGAIGADLQARLKGMVEAAGAKLRSVRNLQPRTDAQLRYVGSHIELSGPIAAIQRAIHAIESAKPYLFVTSGTIRVAPWVGQVGLPQAPLIEARLDIYAAVRVAAREP
jgi:hypothetical protein